MLLAKDSLLPIVNDAFDHARRLHKVRSDEQLAVIFGISRKKISEIRNGHWNKVDLALIGTLVATFQSKNSTETCHV